MRQLALSDRRSVEAYFRRNSLDTFYHYFPLLYAISESTETLVFGGSTSGRFRLLVQSADEYYYQPEVVLPREFRKIWITPYKLDGEQWRSELYDVNYIYELDYTLGLRNFRKNIKKFKKNDGGGGQWYKLDKPDPRALEVVKRWYSISQREDFTDFGYTMWLLDNFHLFPDLNARLLCIDEKPVGFSLWGKLTEDTGIHLICKDTGVPYVQDVLRGFTYQEMKEAGLKYCNDGSDCSVPGIRAYKSKLRPRFIIPIYSWIREG